MAKALVEQLTPWMVLRSTDIALDAAQVRALASEVIFETDKGLSNWLNCANKLQLSPEAALIEKLDKCEADR